MKSFSEEVYNVVMKIPKGETLTYKQVAKMAGSPKAYYDIIVIIRLL